MSIDTILVRQALKIVYLDLLSYFQTYPKQFLNDMTTSLETWFPNSCSLATTAKMTITKNVDFRSPKKSKQKCRQLFSSRFPCSVNLYVYRLLWSTGVIDKWRHTFFKSHYYLEVIAKFSQSLTSFYLYILLFFTLANKDTVNLESWRNNFNPRLFYSFPLQVL